MPIQVKCARVGETRVYTLRDVAVYRPSAQTWMADSVERNHFMAFVRASHRVIQALGIDLGVDA